MWSPLNTGAGPGRPCLPSFSSAFGSTAPVVEPVPDSSREICSVFGRTTMANLGWPPVRECSHDKRSILVSVRHLTPPTRQLEDIFFKSGDRGVAASTIGRESRRPTANPMLMSGYPRASASVDVESVCLSGYHMRKSLLQGGSRNKLSTRGSAPLAPHDYHEHSAQVDWYHHHP